MKKSGLELLVGMFVLLGIGAMAFLAFKVANLTTSGSSSGAQYTIYADFNNIGSLNIGAPVKVSGFKVGQVTEISLNKKTYTAHIAMRISEQYKFSSDSSAEILTTGLLGEQYIGLSSGAEDDMLPDGGTIQITSSALVLEQLIGKFMSNITK